LPETGKKSYWIFLGVCFCYPAWFHLPYSLPINYCVSHLRPPKSLSLLLSPLRASFARNQCLNAALEAPCQSLSLTSIFKAVSTLIPSPDISGGLQVRSHTPAVRTQLLAFSLYVTEERANYAGGVRARLCGHLREMTGLTIRAAVSNRQHDIPALAVYVSA
jgi:hypothetical protein